MTHVPSAKVNSTTEHRAASSEDFPTSRNGHGLRQELTADTDRATRPDFPQRGAEQHPPQNGESALGVCMPREEAVRVDTQTERALRARIAAHTRWANTEDRTASTAAARQAFRDRFEREVDPEGKLPPAERARRAESARKAFYTRLALKSARARRLRREADQLDAEADSDLVEMGGDAA